MIIIINNDLTLSVRLSGIMMYSDSILYGDPHKTTVKNNTRLQPHDG